MDENILTSRQKMSFREVRHTSLLFFLIFFIAACSKQGGGNQAQSVQSAPELVTQEGATTDKSQLKLDHAALDKGGKITEEALYLDRYDRMLAAFSPGGSILSIYDSLAPVPGGTSPTFLVKAKHNFFNEEKRKTIIEFADTHNTSALLVIKDGELILEHYASDYDRDSKLNGKSLAKPLGVVAVGRAIKEGYINSLDQSAADFFSEWDGTPKEKITIRHLLGMRSGLHHQSFVPEPEHIMNRAYLHPRHDEIILHEYPLLHEPGSRYDYSNANAELVAPLIERATGQSYQAWISHEILNKLDAQGGDIWLNREGGIAHAGCCMLLPAEAFAKIGMLVLQDGLWGDERLLPDGYVNDMKQTTSENPHTGLGVYIGHPYREWRGVRNPDLERFPTFHSAPYARDDLYLFDGNSNQVVYLIPSEDMVILRMGEAPPRDKPWDNAYLPNFILESLPQ